MATRPEIVALVKREIEKLRNGRYKPIRGTVNWAKFPFEKHPYPVSLVLPEDDDSGKCNVTTVSMIFMKRMVDRVAFEEIDEEALEEFRDDARTIADRLLEATDGDDSVFFAVLRNPSLEIADSNNEIVGISSSLTLEY